MPGIETPATFWACSQGQADNVAGSATSSPGMGNKCNLKISEVMSLSWSSQVIKIEDDPPSIAVNNSQENKVESPSICHPDATFSINLTSELSHLPREPTDTSHRKLSKGAIRNPFQSPGAVRQAEKSGRGAVVLAETSGDTSLHRQTRPVKAASTNEQELHRRGRQSKSKRLSRLSNQSASATPEQIQRETEHSQRPRRTLSKPKELFSCTLCPERFVYEGNMLEHMCKDHGEPSSKSARYSKAFP